MKQNYSKMSPWVLHNFVNDLYNFLKSVLIAGEYKGNASTFMIIAPLSKVEVSAITGISYYHQDGSPDRHKKWVHFGSLNRH